MMSMNTIVSDGHYRLLHDPGTKEEIKEITTRIEEIYLPRIEKAGFLRKYWIRWMMRSEIENAVNDIIPKHVLYFKERPDGESRNDPDL